MERRRKTKGELTEVTSHSEAEGDWCGEIVVVPFCAYFYMYGDFECVGELKVLFWGCKVLGELL